MFRAVIWSPAAASWLTKAFFSSASLAAVWRLSVAMSRASWLSWMVNWASKVPSLGRWRRREVFQPWALSPSSPCRLGACSSSSIRHSMVWPGQICPCQTKLPLAKLSSCCRTRLVVSGERIFAWAAWLSPALALCWAAALRTSLLAAVRAGVGALPWALTGVWGAAAGEVRGSCLPWGSWRSSASVRWPWTHWAWWAS